MIPDSHKAGKKKEDEKRAFFQNLKNHKNFVYPFNTMLLALDINKEDLRGFLTLSHSSRIFWCALY